MPPKNKNKSKAKRGWQDAAREAQEHRDASISHALANTIEQDVAARITALDPTSIARMTAAGELSAVQVVSAFLRQAATAQQATNCITELLGARALRRAQTLDASPPAASPTARPLLGVPVSVKSHIGIAGGRMAAGYAAWWFANPPAPRDALVVQILEHAGAVAHARTTEPQSMMQLECASNLFGETRNPHRGSELSSGGSSGGEAALLALGGSALGVGSDVGGSVRVPAAACGIFGLKPTAFRVPTTGWSSTPPGADPVPTVVRPMCRTIDGVELFMAVMLAAEPWTVEPAMVPLPWRSIDLRLSDRPLRIGIAWHDGTVQPHPPIARALAQLAATVRALPGVEVVEFPLYNADEAWAIASSLYFTDGGAADVAAMAASGEPPLPLVDWILRESPGTKVLTREELEYWLEEREEYRLEYADYWNRTGRWDDGLGRWAGTVDVLVCPVAPGIATRHGTAKYWAYSAMWNLLDYPALAFPAGTASKKVDVKEQRTSFMSDHDRSNWDLYDADLFDRMSVGLQMVGRRFDDEKVVAVYRYLKE
ncbi:amidase signature domain-containing protein [Lasiosphaeria miniovina]|uniref:amidase n=1 Tax=Lasiosphaeria miniovina TaxID=1954250 RepID=A0AA40B6A0_9PEZI|nr:amidase signature domain-containing protein [Lasiosphaeria miniovina]KAK0728327.1 amidase signature domain-containing protein [Lasiosphaeria miniovina]